MSKGQNGENIFILVGCISGLFIISTGMANMDEIKAALGMLMLGQDQAEIKEPLFEYAIQTFSENMIAKNGSYQYLKNSISLLHCTSEYPAQYFDINLRAIDTLRNEFALETGLSDHSSGIIVDIAAVARGATIIEKHITLDKTLPGPDHKASLSPQELHEMVSAIRNVEDALGDGIKEPRESEKKNISIIRKGIYAKSRIGKGDVVNSENIIVKRPENNLSPYEYWHCQGTITDKSYEPDDALNSAAENA